MAHLTDMEELLAAIPSSDIRDYMREAMNCYMAGAYRGCLVLSYIALFDDLLAKLSELGNVNSSAKAIYVEATKRKNDQDVYESYLIDQLTSKNLISGLDSSFLTTLRTLRNKSAHPSGHKPSPEEARFIFFETISRFLSQPILSTTHLVDELIARLKNTNFFPSATISDIKNVVADETSNLHDEAIPQLVAKLVAAVKSLDAPTRKNASHFILGLARLDKPGTRSALQSKLIGPKADDSAFEDLLTQLFSSNGKLILGLNATTVIRIRAVFSKKIADTTAAISESKLIHPTSALTSIASAMPETDFITTFKPELEALFKKRAHSQFVVKLVQDKPLLLPIYFPLLLAKASSSDFGTANAFSNAVESLDQYLCHLLSDAQAFELIIAIMKAANWGAWSATGVATAKFAGIPLLRNKALSYIASDEVAAATQIEQELSEAKPIDEFVAANLTDEESA